jgi:hypothetical protein
VPPETRPPHEQHFVLINRAEVLPLVAKAAQT